MAQMSADEWSILTVWMSSTAANLIGSVNVSYFAQTPNPLPVILDSLSV